MSGFTWFYLVLPVLRKRLQTGLPALSRRLGKRKHGSKSGDFTCRAGFVHLLQQCRKLLFTRCHASSTTCSFFMSWRRRFKVGIHSAEMSLFLPSVFFSSPLILAGCTLIKRQGLFLVCCGGHAIKLSAICKQNPKTCVSPTADVERLNKSRRRS